MKGSLQEKNGKYYVVCRPIKGGSQKWINTGIETKRGNKRKAEQKMSEILTALDNDTHAYDKILFVDYLQKWLNDIKPTIKPSTWEGYHKVTYGKLIPYFNDKKYMLNELKGMHFIEYFAYLKENGREDNKGGLSRKAIINIRGVLSSAFSYAVSNDMIPYNYIDRSALPVFTDCEKPESVIYTEEEIRQLLEYA